MQHLIMKPKCLVRVGMWLDSSLIYVKKVRCKTACGKQ